MRTVGVDFGSVAHSLSRCGALCCDNDIVANITTELNQRLSVTLSTKA